jgi:hypothetical protein
VIPLGSASLFVGQLNVNPAQHPRFGDLSATVWVKAPIDANINYFKHGDERLTLSSPCQTNVGESKGPPTMK